MNAFLRIAAVLAPTVFGGACVSAGIPPERAAAYEVVARYPIGGVGAWDYIAVDEKRQRIYASRGDHVQVVDAREGKVVGDIAGTAGVHGVAFDDSLGVGFTSNGRSDSVTVFDLDTFAVKEVVKVTGANPDAILFEPFSKRVLTFNGRSASVTAIDAATRKVTGTLAVSGKPEGAVSDEHGRVFVNIEDRNSVAVIDMASFTVVHEWPLTGCENPTGLAIDLKRQRLFSACHNRKMVVLDAQSGNVVHDVPIGAGVDGAEFDPQLDFAFSSNGDGTVTVVEARDANHYSVAGTVATQDRARTLALDRTTHRIYLPTATFGALPAPSAAEPRPRAPMIPGSFVILVLAPRGHS